MVVTSELMRTKRDRRSPHYAAPAHLIQSKNEMDGFSRPYGTARRCIPDPGLRPGLLSDVPTGLSAGFSRALFSPCYRPI
jgi:hypothetical protein